MLECSIPPIIVPLFVDGMEQVMHESRTWPRFLPRIGKNVTCTYGDPIDDALVGKHIARWHEHCRNQGTETEADEIRRDLTKVIRDSVCALRTSRGFPPEHEHAHDAKFYDSEEGLKYDELSGIPRPAIFKPRAKRDKVWERESGL